MKTCLRCKINKPPYMFGKNQIICGWCLLDECEIDITDGNQIIASQEKRVSVLTAQLEREKINLDIIKRHYSR